jgi:cardiolipin synthase
MVPARTDVRLVGWAARSFYRELVDAGVRLFEYQTSMLHAKSIVVDETWGIVGSANVDMRSFRLNFEMGAVLFDREIAGRLVSRFLADCQSSVEITRSALRRTSLARRLAQGVARLLSPVL